MSAKVRLRKLPGSGSTISGVGDNGSQPLRVLVVDDEPNIADVISMALRYEGFDVETAANGTEALAAVNSYRPHLMVLDIMLPDMEGFEVAKRLGGERAELPIVFLTARDTQEDKIRGLTTGGDDYVTKPFSLEELVARIRVILRRTGHAEPDSSRLAFSDLELDEETRDVTRGGRPTPRAQRAAGARGAVPSEPGGPRAPAGIPGRVRGAPRPLLPRGIGGRGPPPDEGGSGPQGLPRGTVGQLRTPLGRVVRSTAVRPYGETALPAPKLPASIPTDKPTTVGSQGGSGLRYRVLAEPTHDHPRLTTVVA